MIAELEAGKCDMGGAASSCGSTRAPSCASLDSDSSSAYSPDVRPIKRRRLGGKTKDGPRAPRKVSVHDLCKVAHQFGLCGGEEYDSKAARLGQLLERLPAQAAGAATRTAVVLAKEVSASEVQAEVDTYRKSVECEHNPVRVITVVGNEPCLPEAFVQQCFLAISYDLPESGEEYQRRVGMVLGGPADDAGVMYTMLDESEMGCTALQEIKEKLRVARGLAKKFPAYGGDAKVAEIDSALLYLQNEFDCSEEDEEEEEEEEEEEDEDGEDTYRGCKCVHCQEHNLASIRYHGERPGRPRVGAALRVEAVRVHLPALKDMAALAPAIAPRLPDHACTIVCLHNMSCHTPWDGYEHMFALPPGMGNVRVVMVLAPNASWHEYLDTAAFAGGVAWSDILDMPSMDAADSLIERLVEHEVGLLGGRGERLVLMGCSQGGGQSMLRFLRSQRRLGGWIGSVCHAPIGPHAPRSTDPIVGPSRRTVNCDRPIRMLAGELDTTFPASFVSRDAKRLREVGGFTDVSITVQDGLEHEGFNPDGSPPELVFLQKHLPSMVNSAVVPVSPASQ